ncbi:MAG: SPOR domain-containing protein [Bacteroidetes bacterium]|nr:SPOR domain-containing protein [Bacteroidota bacterium]
MTYRKFFSLLVFFLMCHIGFGQIKDSTQQNNAVVIKDYRLDILSKREAEINTAILKNQARAVKGYRLMVLNTSNKDEAFKIRTQLLQKFPEQKLYMWFANPYIRIKFGNFRTKEEADVYKKQISKMLNGATIYYLQETVEVDPGPDFNPDDMK